MNDINKSEPATKADLTNGLTGLRTELNQKTDSLDNKITRLDDKVARLEDVTKNIALDMVRAQSDINDIKERMATKDDINRIMSAIDTYTAEAISYRNRDTLRGGKIMEHETKLSNHENRLTSLETK